MNTFKRVGQILRESREERNLSVRDVSKDTNIAMKFILALENEDYSQFPAETFVIGFLKTYSDYLKLDTATILNNYRNQQIEENQQPLEELTKPTVKMIALEIERNKAFIPYIIGVLFLGIFLVVLFYDNNQDTTDPSKVKNTSDVEIDKNANNSTIPLDVTFIPQSVPEGASVPLTLTPEQGATFSVNNQQCKMFIRSVTNKGGENIANIGFNINPERKVFTFEIKVNEEYTLSYHNPELENLRREIKVKAQAITEKSAKVLVTLSDEKTGSTKQPSGDVPIQVTLYFIKSSYAEFVIDGQPGEKGRVIPSGEVKTLEARDRLELKIGDGGAVEMVQNGKERVRLGKPGKIIKKEFFKVPNPYDNTQFIIKERGE